MRPTYMIVPLTCLISAACTSTPSGHIARSIAPMTWQTGPWKIQLQYKDAPHSFYQITRPSGHPSDSIQIPSAFDRSYPSSENEIASLIRIQCSASGKTLLIHEKIPNDSYGCENTILVRLQDGQYQHTWLQIPTAFSGEKFSPNEMPPVARTADILAITDHSLFYRDNDHGARKDDKHVKEIAFSVLKQSNQMNLP